MRDDWGMGASASAADGSASALHTAARRFCWDGIAERFVADLPEAFAHLAPRVRDPFTSGLAWEEVRRHEARLWGELLEYGGTGEYPAHVRERAAMFSAILDEVERAVAGDFRSWDDARTFLLEGGRRARPIGTIHVGTSTRGDDPHWDSDQRSAAAAARSEYLAYVGRLAPADAVAAALARPMPLQRVLPDAEVKEIREECARRWDADPARGYWHPLRQEAWPSDLLVVDDESFLVHFGAARLHAILREHDVARVWEIGECWRVRPAREMETGVCAFVGVETTWSSRGLDWLVYASHENSVTFAGDWLVGAVKAAWPAWEAAGYEHVIRRFHEQRARVEDEMRRARQDDGPAAP